MAQLRAKVQPLHMVHKAVRKAGQRDGDGGMRLRKSPWTKAIHPQCTRAWPVYSIRLANASV